MECGWFDVGFLGAERRIPSTKDDPDREMRIAVEIPLAELLADYERVCAQHRTLVHSHSLDALSKRELEGRPSTLRYVLLHLIEETARHNGHIDILREMADGVTGVSPTARYPGLRRQLRGEVLHPATGSALLLEYGPATAACGAARAHQPLGRVGVQPDHLADRSQLGALTAGSPRRPRIAMVSVRTSSIMWGGPAGSAAGSGRYGLVRSRSRARSRERSMSPAE